MAHNRVTKEGQQMGQNASRLSDLGFTRLQKMGLHAVDAPRLRKDMCETCACRLGTVPNGCLQTQMDFLKSAVEGKPFFCHSPSNGSLCTGWVRVRAEIVANPLPNEIAEMLAKWEYTPANTEMEGGAV